MRKLAFFAFAATLLPLVAHAASQPAVPIEAAGDFNTVATWIQMVPGGGAEVRAVTTRGCPYVVFDGANGSAQPQIPMKLRAAASADFPAVCSLAVPLGVKTVSVAMSRILEPARTRMLDLAAPVADPRRILVLGDTGCRIKGTALQACNDPKAWPFAGLSAAAAVQKPDLVIHLGDYLYRESPCPATFPGCAGSPWGDNWPAWNADFFAPAAPLLEAAPWIVIRGNHEDCYRAGPGFLRLLGPAAYDPAAPCNPHLDPYAVPLGGESVAIMDSASPSDTALDDQMVAAFRTDFAAIKAMGAANPGHPLWFATHRPIWAAISGPLGLPIGGNINLITAAGDLSAFQAIALMLSGHIHSFEAINYEAKVPPQIVAGHGGDNLDVTPSNLRGAIFQGHSGVRVANGLSVGGFGFLMMTRIPGSDGWSIELYDSVGTPIRQCQFASGAVRCLKAR